MSSVAATAAPPHDSLIEIEARLRGRPEAAAAALQQAARKLPVASTQHIETQLARGEMLVRMADAEAVEQLAREIEQAAPPGALTREPLAVAAAAMLRGHWLHRHGSLGR
ncbi:MAG: hypothetical protein H7Z19_15545, partial [Chitinophagaceae bacterium]|nr:hypothetical protein [Rubrivivax sp.]